MLFTYVYSREAFVVLFFQAYTKSSLRVDVAAMKSLPVSAPVIVHPSEVLIASVLHGMWGIR